jgi:hypothetical protein
MARIIGMKLKNPLGARTGRMPPVCQAAGRPSITNAMGPRRIAQLKIARRISVDFDLDQRFALTGAVHAIAQIAEDLLLRNLSTKIRHCH